MARLFHSLVVCGAGLTLVHCGGRSISERQGDGGADETSGTGPGTTAGSGGSTPAQGGASAGALSLGGEVNLPTAGSSAGGPTEPRRPQGPTEQWGCDASTTLCSNERFNLDYLDCAADPTRPVEPGDCLDGAVFACLRGVLDDEPVLFNCACNVVGAPGCVCPEILDNCKARIEVPQTCTADTSECGCAITCILK